MIRVVRGFSLIESLFVMAIVAILASIGFAVFIRARGSGHVGRSIEHMRQLGAAIALYRVDYGESGPNLGLPPKMVHLKRDRHLPDELFHTGGSTMGLPHGDVYTYLVPEPTDVLYQSDWTAYLLRNGEQSVVLVDETQNDGPNPKVDVFSVRTALGLHLDCHVTEIRSTGSLSDTSYWESR